MTDQAKPLSRPWRKYLRFTVRWLIVPVLLVGGWFGWIVRSARIPREAVVAITTAGSVVGYDLTRPVGDGAHSSDDGAIRALKNTGSARRLYPLLSAHLPLISPNST